MKLGRKKAHKPTETTHTFAIAFAVDTKEDGTLCGLTPHDAADAASLYITRCREQGESRDGR
jgi:hypothetical protein